MSGVQGEEMSKDADIIAEATRLLKMLLADCEKVARDPDVSAQVRNRIIEEVRGWTASLNSGSLSKKDMYGLIESIHGEISMMSDKCQRFDVRYREVTRRLDRAIQFVIDEKGVFIGRKEIVFKSDWENCVEIRPVLDIQPFGLIKEHLSYSYDMWISKGCNPLGVEAIFKCKETTANEVFGYMFASKTGFPVPDFKGVWFKNDFVLPDNMIRLSGSIGLFVKKIAPSCEISLDGILQISERIAAQNLLLRLFLGGGEYPQTLVSGSELVFYDLEFVGPQLLVGDSAEVLRANADQYVKNSGHQLEVILKLVSEYDLLNLFMDAFKALGKAIERSEFMQQVSGGHPQSEIMSKVFFKAVAKRYEKCLKSLD
jgi:hypothetical protein